MDIDSEIKGNLTPEECQRLSRVKSSLHKYNDFHDILPQDEMDEKIQEEERRTQVSYFFSHCLQKFLQRGHFKCY